MNIIDISAMGSLYWIFIEDGVCIMTEFSISLICFGSGMVDPLLESGLVFQLEVAGLASS